MANSWRISALAEQHRKLGAELEDWNGMGTAWNYAVSDTADDHETIRTRAGLMDVSGLKKIHCNGPHAQAVLDYVTTRDMSKLYPGKSVYASVLNEAGKFVDDCIVYCLAPNSYLVVHGTGTANEMLAKSALGRAVSLTFDDDMHDMSLQGPVAVDFLERHVPGIRELRYFHHLQTQLFGYHVMISRTGYTGERGYEIFCKAKDAPSLWEQILEEGADMGIKPCSFGTLDWLRVESHLLFYPADNSETYPYPDQPVGDTLWELGLDFTVSPGKTEFRGASEHFALQGKERVKVYGVLLDSKDVAQIGDKIYADGKCVGVITQGMYSRLSDRSMALARLEPGYAEHGTPLTLKTGTDGETSLSAISHSLPFDDPEKAKRLARG
ncbi:aminomethyltransferase family protein [Cobetia marina]|uniref:aminomethyltransferase family protein n=1 Tax=Cobetia marina TaxID=28258 RepID=UPI0025479D64|nr:aminomethyltransferase family protein [Cobetia pacifica]MDI6002394.1 aminomethyltransferase family protein [Cobetia pacifica]